MSIRKETLAYHAAKPAGKLEINPTKPCSTQHDLALAYTPGVAEPCLEIERDPDASYLYTARGNLVAVVTNGTAVLGLGDIGPLAAKPVMEGKALLFKRFADIDAIDIELASHDTDEIIRTVEMMEPSFGGINLEDIKAPECFIIEQALRAKMNIPVFHDDQHGTAIISGAALLNALEVVGKEIGEVRIVFSGAGAAAIATAKFYVELGADKKKILIVDSKGVVYAGRAEGMNPWKAEFACETEARTLADAMVGADVFVGLSQAGVLKKEMVRTMAERPIVFALANPDPEITYPDAKEARPDALVATGRSDFPNQVNNVLGFPFLFRGALDVRATSINEEMKIAAAHALADLAREDVPDSVVRAYGEERISFGDEYLIPKPFDPRVMLWVTPAVAKAAMESGVARVPLDLDQYRDELEARLGKSREMMRIVFNKARKNPKRVVLAEGTTDKVIRAAHLMVEEGIAQPLLLGDEVRVRALAAKLQLDMVGVEVEDPEKSPRVERYAERIYELRCRRGVTHHEAHVLARDPNYYAAAMVEMGDADAMISGLNFHYPDGLRAPLQLIRTAPNCRIAAGVYLVTTRQRVLFFADCTVNAEMDPDKLAEVAMLTARLARDFDVEPRVALLTFSNFGSTRHPRAERVRQAVEIIRRREPELVVDGEMQANVALNPELLNSMYPCNLLRQEANVLIFPNLESGNIAYKLMQRLGNAEVVGPILVGMAKPVHILQRGDEVKDIVNLTAIAVVEAQKLAAKESRKALEWS